MDDLMTVFTLAIATDDAAKAADIAAQNVKHIIELHDNVMYYSLAFAGVSLACAFVAYIVSAIVAYRNAQTAHVVAQNLPALIPADSHDLLPDAGDLAKIIDSLKGLVDSLSKASPMVAWVVAAMIFTGIAGYVASDLWHSSDKPASPHHPATDTADGGS